MRLHTKASKIAFLGMMLALMLIFGYLETLFVIIPQVPGIKLGLPNLMLLMILYKKDISPFTAFGVNIARILLSAFLFGNVMNLIYALSGGLIALLVMYLMSRVKTFSCVGTSTAGGIVHNVVQCYVASLITSSRAVFLYMPVLIVFGGLSGFINGWISVFLLKYLNKE